MQNPTFENGKFHRSKHFEYEFQYFLTQKLKKFHELPQKGDFSPKFVEVKTTKAVDK